MPINTLEASKRLKELGFNEDQSEGLAQLLSELGVASATKEDLDELEERLTNRIDRLGDRIDDVEASLGGRIDDVETRIGNVETHLNEKFATKTELTAVKSDLEKRIEQMEKRLLVVGIPVVAALMALLNYLM